jgi:protein SCO1/2
MTRWQVGLVMGWLSMGLAGVWPVAADHGSSHEHPHAKPSSPLPAPQTPVSAAHQYFTNVVLVNQHGENMRLYSDLLKDKVVVIGSFFTQCEGACPMLSAKFAQLQDWLGERLQKQVYLILFTVDPETDTPEKLNTYAAKLKAKPGWYFMTGTKQHVDWALYKLGHYVEKKEAHRNIIIIGNEPTGLWKKALSVATAEDLVRILDSVLQDQG